MLFFSNKNVLKFNSFPFFLFSNFILIFFFISRCPRLSNAFFCFTINIKAEKPLKFAYPNITFKYLVFETFFAAFFL